jgi:hypothetical protein
MPTALAFASSFGMRWLAAVVDVVEVLVGRSISGRGIVKRRCTDVCHRFIDRIVDFVRRAQAVQHGWLFFVVPHTESHTGLQVNLIRLGNRECALHLQVDRDELDGTRGHDEN